MDMTVSLKKNLKNVWIVARFTSSDNYVSKTQGFHPGPCLYILNNKIFYKSVYKSVYTCIHL